ncbi:hypothetical protein RSEGYP2_16 [Ralstonia phage RsoP1EGY]|uniref:Uncharacterized protein n=1 Tax=Ralstonia phage RsoP1EGY TaxID=2070026 RepID=A0A2R2ZGB2_9CAUD|nr:hypothetical protein HOT00_gp16 [Ralstonia phage RsoP1EGY]AUO78177.1 hypothetical protein RSEGYP2_16 [Ralstonia phage RsoP1EGY]
MSQTLGPVVGILGVQLEALGLTVSGFHSQPPLSRWSSSSRAASRAQPASASCFRSPRISSAALLRSHLSSEFRT